MVLKYFEEHSQICDEVGHCVGYEGDYFYYEPDDQDLEDALVKILTFTFFNDYLALFPEQRTQMEKRVRAHVKLCNQDQALEEAYYQELYDYFEAKARGERDANTL